MANFDATTEHQPIKCTAAGQRIDRGHFRAHTKGVEAEGSELATETRWLLQLRLRAASLVLVVGFSLFLARSFILYTGSSRWLSSSMA